MGSDETPGSASHFRFLSGYSPRDDRAVPRFRLGLNAALNEAAGLGIAFTLSWSTGRAAGPAIEVDREGGRRWLQRSLAHAYGGARWVEYEAGAEARILARWGRVDAVGGLPALDPRLGMPWSEAAVRGLRSLPAGAEVRWSFLAATTRPAQGPRPPTIEPVHVAPGYRLSPSSASERAVRDAMDARQRTVAWAMGVRLMLTDERARQLVDRVAVLVQRTGVSAAGTAVTWHRPLPWHRRAPPLSLLSGPEVAGLLPEPWGTGAIPDAAAGPGESFVVGRSEEGGVVRLPIPVGEGRHLAVLGQTGMGKSTVLVRLALQAARASSVVVFDPIGDTARELVDQLPGSRVARTLWIDAARGNATFNALAPLADPIGSPAYRAKAKADLVAALRRVRMFRYADTPFWGPRLEEMLERAVDAAAAYPDGTLVDAEALLRGVGRRVPTGVPESARASVEALDALARARPDEVDGARRLLAEVTSSEGLRRLLCDPTPTCHPSALVRPGGITLVTGEAPTLGEGTARYFLAVLLALAWAELLSRPGGAKTFLVLDEAQWYAHDAVAETLRLGRRSNVHLWLATQSLHSLSDPVREAVLTNAADFLVFRGSPDDAREFARWRPDTEGDEVLMLGRGEAMGWLGKGERRVRIQLAPLPPSDPMRARRAEVIASSARGQGTGTTSVASGGGGEAPPLALLELVFAVRDASTGSATFEFPFARARRQLALSDAAIRELGSTLRQCGALLGRVPTADEGTWTLSGTAIDRMRSERGPAPLPSAARAAQERLRQLDSSL